MDSHFSERRSACRNGRLVRCCLNGLVVVASVGLFVSLAAADTLYVVHGSRGVLTFTTRRPGSADSFEVFKPRVSRYSRVLFQGVVGDWWTPKARASEYDSVIHSTAREHSVEPALVKAVIHAESAFNPRAVSRKGALGLMQLMPATARRFGIRNAFQPVDNIQAGVKYLSLLLNRYNGNTRLALAAYNAGEYIVDDLQEIPPYRETQDYVRRVLALLTVYRNADARG